MKNKSETFKYCVCFALTKGEGDWPTPEILTKQEKADPRKFSTFFLDVDEDACSIDLKAIKSCTVIYDGVSPVTTKEHDENLNFLGLLINDGQIIGKPKPIIEFELTQYIEESDFIKLIWMSYYKLHPKNSEDSFYSEDHNGYTEILDEDSKEEWIALLKKHKIYSGKKVSLNSLRKGLSASKM